MRNKEENQIFKSAIERKKKEITMVGERERSKKRMIEERKKKKRTRETNLTN